MSKGKFWLTYILVILGIAVLLAAGVNFFTKDPYDSYARAVVAQVDTIPVDGKKLSVPENIFFKFRFQTPKAELVHFSAVKGLYIARNYKPGKAYLVNYDSSDPNKVYLPDPTDLKDWTEAAIFGWVFISAFLALVFAMMWKSRVRTQNKR